MKGIENVNRVFEIIDKRPNWLSSRESLLLLSVVKIADTSLGMILSVIVCSPAIILIDTDGEDYRYFLLRRNPCNRLFLGIFAF